MTTPRMVCFMCFALLLVMAHANPNGTDEISNLTQTMANENNSTTPTSYKTPETYSQGSAKSSIQIPYCTPAPTEPMKGQCIFFLPNKETMELVLAALTVACFALLLTTLMCACQVCHLRGIISRLKPHHDNADMRAFREWSESPFKDKDHAHRKPTETCVMLSEVTTAQEEWREDEESVLEDKAEDEGETEHPNAESSTDGPNGDVNQENSTGVKMKELDTGAPESKDAVV
ncbi:uncharacterized protein LOC127433122 isoform X2 [Myxocyprinus asiaticus]|uniref:uncharacterized protein LOC127433122 isoform X2 n=1 Tax=Myxocyprinus asiaticus TaxID=70543 RepID=UPI002223A834|nr:uncharacterized protein LOC127433122 isoform X2 [Myxocyprinus asiaticus]